jgi:signal transduction histidine kinase
LKYSKEGEAPHVKINASVVKGGTELNQKNALPYQQYLKLSIADNGIGFEQKYADKIFELFQRLHNREKYSGTGIGLAICKKIAENHYGFISAQSEPGLGTIFFVYLPVENEK